MGLEAEHDLNRQWLVSEEDEKVIHEIVEELKGGDSEWAWENEEMSWTFGAVQLTEGTSNRALALHMIHRHGLGALLAARNQNGFSAFLEGRTGTDAAANGSAPDIAKADSVSEAIETYQPVEHLLKVLENDLSLSALRNLHSFDHQWSTQKNLGVGCFQNPGVCVLQAGLSKKTHKFMADHGFTEATCEKLQERQGALLQELSARAMRNDSLPGLLAPKIHEIWHDYKGREMVTTTDLRVVDLSEGGGGGEGVGKHVKGIFVFEEILGKATPWPVNMPISDEKAAEAAKLSGDELESYLVGFVEERIEQKVKEHKEWMGENRLHFWAGEDSEFASLTPTAEQWKQIGTQQTQAVETVTAEGTDAGEATCDPAAKESTKPKTTTAKKSGASPQHPASMINVCLFVLLARLLW